MTYFIAGIIVGMTLMWLVYEALATGEITSNQGE
jgi:hypothetical protein